MIFFGCIDRPGHFVWSSERDRLWSRGSNIVSWLESCDGKLPPRGTQDESATALHHVFDGAYTALAMWDRTVDSRPGSNAVFLEEGVRSRDEMIELARAAFPNVAARLVAFSAPAEKEG